MEKNQDKTLSVKYTATAFGAGKPVAPFSGQSFSGNVSSLDPSSYLRVDRYPIPSSLDGRSNGRERNFS